LICCLDSARFLNAPTVRCAHSVLVFHPFALILFPQRKALTQSLDEVMNITKSSIDENEKFRYFYNIFSSSAFTEWQQYCLSSEKKEPSRYVAATSSV